MANRPVPDVREGERAARVLVVDDTPSLLQLLTEALDAWGYEARVARGAREARAIVAEWQPDVVLADMMMAPEDGASLIVELRQRYGQAIRLILYSARTDVATGQAAANEVPADAFLPKPFNLEALEAAIQGKERSA